MKEQEKEMIKNLVEEYIKFYKKIPNINKLIKENPGLTPVLEYVKTNNNLLLDYLNILKEIVINKILKGKTNMNLLIKEYYLEDVKSFNKFIQLNLEGKNNGEFQKLGLKIKQKLDIAENRLLGNVENGKYADYAAALSDKFQNYLISLFPLWSNIGLKIIKKGNN